MTLESLSFAEKYKHTKTHIFEQLTTLFHKVPIPNHKDQLFYKDIFFCSWVFVKVIVKNSEFGINEINR